MPLRDHIDELLVPVNGCLEWPKSRDPAGYGRVRDGKESVYVHRYVWERKHGPIPEGLLLRHSCDNPPCANLEHLSLGTHKDNAADRDSRGRNGNVTHGRYVGGVPRKFANRQEVHLSQRTLTAEQVREIRVKVEAGQSSRSIAREYGISRASIYRIVHKLVYADIV